MTSDRIAALEAELKLEREKRNEAVEMSSRFEAELEQVKAELGTSEGLNDLLLLDGDKVRDLLTAERERAKGLADALEQAGKVIFRYGDNSDSYTHRDQLMKDFKATKEALLKYKGEL